MARRRQLGWEVVEKWTFIRPLAMAKKAGGWGVAGWTTRLRRQGGYRLPPPDDRTLMGEVLYRGFIEGA